MGIVLTKRPSTKRLKLAGTLPSLINTSPAAYQFVENFLTIGDVRCDSPGYSAKYGTYTIMEASSSKIIDFHVSHVQLSGNSARMEKGGLLKLLDLFGSFPLTIKSQ